VSSGFAVKKKQLKPDISNPKIVPKERLLHYVRNDAVPTIPTISPFIFSSGTLILKTPAFLAK